MWLQSPCIPAELRETPYALTAFGWWGSDRDKPAVASASSPACRAEAQAKAGGGAGGIRTLDRALQPYNGLANRRLQPLGHSSMCADMPDARASRKRQIQITPRPFGGAGATRFRNARFRGVVLQEHRRRDLGTRALRAHRGGGLRRTSWRASSECLEMKHSSRERDSTPLAGDSVPAQHVADSEVRQPEP